MEYQEWKQKYYTGNESYFKKYYEKFREENTRHCIYFIVTEELKVKYCGSTDNMYAREISHMNGFSSVELTEEKWNANKLDHFEVAWCDGVTKQERLYMEYYLIEKYSDNDLLNEYEPYKVKFKDIEELKKCELEEMAEALVFNIYKR